MIALTDRQAEVLAAVARWIRTKGYAPSFREIGDCLGIASPNGVAVMLDVLERKGMIERADKRARSIVLTDAARAVVGDGGGVESGRREVVLVELLRECAGVVDGDLKRRIEKAIVG